MSPRKFHHHDDILSSTIRQRKDEHLEKLRNMNLEAMISWCLDRGIDIGGTLEGIAMRAAVADFPNQEPFPRHEALLEQLPRQRNPVVETEEEWGYIHSAHGDVPQLVKARTEARARDMVLYFNSAERVDHEATLVKRVVKTTIKKTPWETA